MKVKSQVILLVLLVLSIIVVSLYACPPAVIANLDVFRTHVILSRPVILDGSGSYTEGAATITEYAWDFDYDGSSFDPNYIETSSSHSDGAFDGITTHTYGSTGTYDVVLRVKDGTTLADTDTYDDLVISEDSDSDELPDSWETAYSVSDPEEDYYDDNDGYDNLCEYLHGSDPTDDQSVPDRNITIYVPQDISTIKRAAEVAIDGDTIIVDEGTYTENIVIINKSIQILSTDPNDWQVVANTIIESQQSNNNVINIQESCTVRGFTITGGSTGIYCGASAVVSNCLITGNSGNSYGGGIEASSGISLLVDKCYIYSNSSTYAGGGISVYRSDLTVTNSVFFNNSSDFGGAVEFYYEGSPTGHFKNCTFYNNQADDDGGGIYNDRGIVDVNNCIFWGNTATDGGPQIYNISYNPVKLSYSLIEGGLGADSCNYDCIDLGGNITTDPCFIDANDPNGEDDILGTDDDGLQLTFSSFCIDGGDPNTDVNDVNTVDITGKDRFLDGDNDGNSIIDMGAYETPKIWLVDKDATDGNDNGTCWEDAFVDLQSALSSAQSGEQIWVAEGTYYPTTGTDRTIRFELVEGVSVYGGFNSSETRRSQRDWAKHRTVLSGDIDENGNLDSDNSKRIVDGADDAILDGFIIAGAYYDTVRPGGALWNNGSSPTIVNCVFRDNYAVYSGAAVLNDGLDEDIYPVFTNCFFMNNEGPSGGAVYNIYAYPTFTNCVFSKNEGTDGGAMYNSNSCPVVTNCSFAGNDATTGGAIYNADVNCVPEFINTTIWGNTATTASQIYNNNAVPTYTYCNIEDSNGSDPNWYSYLGTDLGGNKDSDPCFANLSKPAGNDDRFGTYDDGLRLLTGSGSIDSADGSKAPELDVLGLARKDLPATNDGTGTPNFADMGSYESYAGVDADSDGLPDDWEMLYGLATDSNDAEDDLDGDGLTNIQEYQLGTRPDSEDTDDDIMDDAWEVEYGFDPLEDDDALEDADGDGMTNLEEYQNGSDPLVYNGQTIVEYEYDNAGNVLTEKVKNSGGTVLSVTENSYNAIGRRWQSRKWASTTASDDANDIITLYDFDTRSNIVKTAQKGIGATDDDAIEAADLVTNNYYDSLGRFTDVNDPNGDNTHYTYYAGGKIYTITDPMNNTITRSYDNVGRLANITDADDNYRTMEYDSLSRVIKNYAYDSLDVALMQARSEYDGVGHLTRRAVMADADSASAISTSSDMLVDYNYVDVNGLLVDQTKYYASGTQAVTSYQYDDLGRRISTTDPCNNQTLLTYDGFGRIIQRQQIDDNPLAGGTDLNITANYVYDSQGKLRAQIVKGDVNDSGTWQTTVYSYNALGSRTQQLDPDDILTVYSYNALGQLTSKVEDYGDGEINRTTQYGHDRLGRQTEITGYANGSTAQTTTYSHNKKGNITNIEYPDGNDIDYIYNAAGKVVQRTDQRGIVTSYNYDENYNLTGKSATVDSIANVETFSYDGLNRMLTADKTTGGSDVSQTEFTYNDLSRITDTNETLFSYATKSIGYSYDQAGYLTSTKYPDASGSEIDITPDYQGRVSAISSNSYELVSYEYMGPRVVRRYYQTSNIYYEPVYDDLGRISTSRNYKAATDITKFDYSYDPNTNNISDMVYAHRGISDPCTTDFSYDNLDRLTIAEYGISDNNEVFAMDELGNRTSVNNKSGTDIAYTVNNINNRYSSVASNSLAYDNAGNLITDEQDYGYEYDYENRIVKITDSNSTIAEYAYDALGRRIRKIADSDTRLYYYNNNNQVLIATDTFDNLKEWSIFGNYIDEVVYSMGGYCVHDHLYSVVAITSTTGIVLERYEYDAYGQPTFYNADFSTSYSTSQLSAETPYLFTGRRVDILDAGSLKLQYNRNRYYSYSLGRWLTQDPLGITPNPQFPNEFYIIDQYEDGSNIYEYTGGNPVVNLDAYGLNYAPPPAPGPEIYDVKGECPTKCCKTSYSKSKCPVKMVPVWHCTRKLGGFPIQVPALALEHCYVCLSGPNSGCLGVQAKIPSCVDACKKAYPNSWQKRRKCKKACRALKGTEIEPEMDPTGKCTKRCLTPEESTKLAGQASNMARNYELLGYNCCAWSNSVTSTKCK